MPLESIYQHLFKNELFRLSWGAKNAHGEEWQKIKADFEARLVAMQKEAIQNNWLQPQAVYGYWPCHSDGDDLYRSYFDRVVMSGNGYYNRASEFEFSYAYSSSGNDTALMFDSLGDDTFRAYEDRVIMTGSEYYNRATGFDSAAGFSTGGTDFAMLYDGTGNDAAVVHEEGVYLKLESANG